MNRTATAIGLLILLGGCGHDESARISPNVATASVPTAGGVTHELVGTRWALVRLGSRPVTVREGVREPFIALESAERRIVGHAGCNRMAGGYELSGEQLHFEKVATTRMACPEMATEDVLLKALNATVRWSITGENLQLFDADGATVATFAARNL